MEPVTTSALALIPETRREVLRLLKLRGPLPAQEMAESLEMTVSGVRQHLSSLERQGAVTHEKRRNGPGRPRHVYRLTPAGDALFPRRYGELANELLGYLEDESPELLETIFQRRRERRIAEARERLEGLDPAARVEELARILDEDGYDAGVQLEPDGTLTVVERNCAVRVVAERYRQACTSEIDFLRAALPEAEVERTSHIARGDHACAYRIRFPGTGRSGSDAAEQDQRESR